jgi:hypothetical protein
METYLVIVPRSDFKLIVIDAQKVFALKHLLSDVQQNKCNHKKLLTLNDLPMVESRRKYINID